MTLSELGQRMLPEELLLWSVYFDLQAQEEKAAQEKALKKRR